jgi:cullin-associated NEDD8-dissociated protein 1
MCSANVVEVAVFNRSDVLPTAAEVVERLAVGSVPPSTYDTGTYTRCTSATCLAAAPDVVVYLHAGASPPGSLDMRAIFQVRVNGTTTYLLNKESILSLGDYSFRNPPKFVSWVEPAAREAEYETSALLDHLVHHPNTAPFVVYRLIQRLVTSNPSPRYVSAVVEAFRTGQVNGSNSLSSFTFSGQYGDLGATFAAILLDREARSLTLERDPSFGQLREPLLKLLHLMRAMEFVSKDGREIELAGVFRAIGQQVFQSPSVFNFYKPEFQASGAILAAELASPEAELSTTPFLVGFLNGISSLVRLGLTSCEDGFGSLFSNAKTAVGGGFPPIASSRSCEKPAERFFSPPQVGGVDGSSNDGELAFRPTNASDAAATVAELDLLLTAGRLSPNTRALLESEYERMRLGPLGWAEYVIATSQNCSAWMAADVDSIAECEDAARYLRNYSAQAFGLFTATNDGLSASRTRARGCYHRKTSSAEELKFNLLRNNYGVCTTVNHCLCKVAGERRALKRAQELLVISPEFHSVNEPQPYNVPRAMGGLTSLRGPPTASQGRPYKAVVVLFLSGGLDSWNLLVPHSGCVAGNFSTNYEQYEATRGIVALGREELLQVSARPGTQPHTVCTTFGVHPALPIVHSLYGVNQAAFFANTGTLVRPLTKAQFLANSVEMPPQLFAHNIQVRCAQSVHAQQIAAKGVLGRVVDALGAAGGAAFRTASYSLDGLKKMLDGDKPHTILDGTGAKRFGRYGALRAQITNLTSGRQRSLFTETYAQFIEASLASSEQLGSMLETVALLSTRWSPRDAVNNDCFESETCHKFEQVARVIASHAVLQEERQVFYVELGGFDTHTSAKEVVQLKLNDINAALTAFVDEMRLRGLWSSTAVVTASDFARTLDSNGAGTDHAWGGNYVLLGGGVSGGTIHGQYPTSYLSTNEVTVLRNRLMPTTSWEAVWHGIAQWLDVPAAQMAYVLPNAANFPTTQLLRKEDLFTTSTVPTGGGGGGGGAAG